MAYKDSDQIANDSNYALGDYSFRIERTSVPGSTNDKIEAICTDKDGKNARKSVQIPSSANVEGWYVEANETEASVYILVKDDGGIHAMITVADGEELTNPPHTYGYRCSATPRLGMNPQGASAYVTRYNGAFYIAKCTANFLGCLYSSSGSSAGGSWGWPTYRDTFVQYNNEQFAMEAPVSTIDPTGKTPSDVPESGEMLVARFAIDIEDAGGDGPGSDWIDPGDYDPDWEPDDPTHTLYVEVTGALSGRHNDPIVNPSFSYIPADKDTVKDYGCGGDGGHGGGGGAGASTVVVHKFATNQANSKEVTALAKRHGYGSGGGKGGKGGDGCILVYY